MLWLVFVLIITFRVKQLLLFLYGRWAHRSLGKLSGFVQDETGRTEVDFNFPKSRAVFFKCHVKFFWKQSARIWFSRSVWVLRNHVSNKHPGLWCSRWSEGHTLRNTGLDTKPWLFKSTETGLRVFISGLMGKLRETNMIVFVSEGLLWLSCGKSKGKASDWGEDHQLVTF